MAIYLRLLVFFLAGLTVSAQVAVLSSLDALTNRTALRGETVLVASGLASNDWGGIRVVKHYTNSSLFSTNLGNTWQAKGATNGQWRAADATNTVQDARWWGAKPGSSPVAAIHAARDWIYSSFGQGTVVLSGGTYNPTSAVVGTNGVSLEIRDATLDFSGMAGGTNYPVNILYQGSYSGAISLGADAPAGTNQVQLSSSLSLSAGDLITIRGGRYSGDRESYVGGNLYEVLSVTSGTNVALKGRTYEAYTAADSEVRKITPVTASVFGNGTIVFPQQGGGLQVISAKDFDIAGLKMYGSEYAQWGVFNSLNTSIEKVIIKHRSTDVGLNYGGVAGGVDGLYLRGCRFETTRHGFSTGTSAIYSLMNRNVRVTGSFLGSDSEGTPGADFHGNTEYSGFELSELPNGVSMGGNHNWVRNSTIRNGLNTQAIALGEAAGADFDFSGNTIELSRGTNQTVFGLRFRVQDGSYTNTWHAGLGASASSDVFKFRNNSVSFLQTVESGSTAVYGLFLDEASSLTGASATFGGLLVSGNTFSIPGQSGSSDLTLAGIVVQPKTKLNWRNVDISGVFGPLAITLYPRGDTWSVHDATFKGVPTSGFGAIDFVVPSTIGSSVRMVVDNVDIDGTSASGVAFSGIVGTVEVKNSRFRAWSDYGIRTLYGSGQDTNIASILLDNNRYERGDKVGSMYARYAASPGAALTIERETVESGINAWSTHSVASEIERRQTTNTFSWWISAAEQATLSSGSFWVTNLTTPVLTTPSAAIAAATIGSLTVTNAPTVTFSNLLTKTISFGSYPQTEITSDAVPFYGYWSTNTLLRGTLQNPNTGTAAGSAFDVSVATGAGARFAIYPTNSASGTTYAGRMFLENTAGNGATISFPVGKTLSLAEAGTSFADWTSTALSLRAATNASAPAWIAGFTADPSTGTQRALTAYGISTLGLQPLDTDLTQLAAVSWATGDFAYRDATGMTNFASTSAGRSVLSSSASGAGQVFQTTSSSGGGWTYTPQVSSITLRDTGTVGTYISNGSGATGYSNWVAVAGSSDFWIGPAADDWSSYAGIRLVRSGATTLSSIAMGAATTVPDDAYGAGWDGSTAVPTKNAVYDKIQSLGSSGITGIRVSGYTGSTVDGTTNLSFSVAPGTGFGITSSGSSPNVTIDFEDLYPGFLVNSTGQTYHTDRWNLNSTTPAAPTGYVNATPATSSTNLTLYFPGVFAKSSTRFALTNSTTQTGVSITLPSLPDDGDTVELYAAGVMHNATGGNVSYYHRTGINGVAMQAFGHELVATSGNVTRSPHFVLGTIQRASSTTANATWRSQFQTSAGLSSVLSQTNAISITWSATTNVLTLDIDMSSASTNAFLYMEGYRVRMN